MILNPEEYLNGVSVSHHDSMVTDNFAFIEINTDLPGPIQNLPEHRHFNFYSIILVVDGAGNYTSEKSLFNIKPGTVLLLHPNNSAPVKWIKTNLVYKIIFNLSFLIRYAGVNTYKYFPVLSGSEVISHHVCAGSCCDYLQIYHQARTEYSSGSPFRMHIIANLLTLLLLKIQSESLSNPSTKRDTNNSDQDVADTFFKNLNLYVEHLMTRKNNIHYKVKDFAKMQGLHENYLTTVIKNKTGKSIQAWITEIKIGVAKNLMENKKLSIKEIAYQSGFSSVSNFSSFFKRNTGITPSTYQRKPGYIIPAGLVEKPMIEGQTSASFQDHYQE